VNLSKSMPAPVAAIIDIDMVFYEKLPQLLPRKPVTRACFAGKPERIIETEFCNSFLQGAYSSSSDAARTSTAAHDLVRCRETWYRTPRWKNLSRFSFSSSAMMLRPTGIHEHRAWISIWLAGSSETGI